MNDVFNSKLQAGALQTHGGGLIFFVCTTPGGRPQLKSPCIFSRRCISPDLSFLSFSFIFIVIFRGPAPPPRRPDLENGGKRKKMKEMKDR